MGNKSYKPTSLLSKYIDRFYVFKKCNKLPSVLPGTGLELLFHFNNSLVVNNKKLPIAHTVCPRKILYFDEQKEVSFLSVRFKSGRFRHFTSIPFSQLNNQYFSVQELWNEQAEHLIRRVKSEEKIENKIQKIEMFLTQKFKENHKEENDKWDLIIDELYYNFDKNSIEKLAKKSNLSLRQFERGFKSQFGMTAKEFQKITRFQDVVKKILLNKTPNYLDIVLDNGYFDQSHFIKEFKSYTNKTPSDYFIEENFNIHFYHKSINKKSKS